MNEPFCTSTGLPIPTLTPAQAAVWWQRVAECGLSPEMWVETAGRSGAMLTLGWLGQDWQLGRVVVLVGNGLTGAVALSAARHLANRCLNVRVWLKPEMAAEKILQNQYNLYRRTGAQRVDLQELSGETAAVVLVGSELPLIPEVWTWVAQSGAEVLRIGAMVDGTAAATLVLGLPVKETPYGGQLYLADVGIPLAVYEQMGLYHRFVFGNQYIIPIYAHEMIQTDGMFA
ncbi:MAG: NAD(P)H-hydrate epimerase [Gloeomargarita sp. DG02_4_bins_56]